MIKVKVEMKIPRDFKQKLIKQAEEKYGPQFRKLAGDEIKVDDGSQTSGVKLKPPVKLKPVSPKLK